MTQELHYLPAMPRRSAPRAVSLSQRLWGLDWEALLPWQIDDVSVDLGSLEEALPFMRDHYTEIFSTGDGRFFTEMMSEAKRRFFAEMDIFVLRVAAETVGLVMGHPSDWSTYYMRNGALLPEYRARGVLPRFLEHIYEPLRAAGAERIETDASPSNQAVIRLHLSQGAVVTATGSSERWGAFVRFTKFLNEEPLKVFNRQFCSMPVRTGLPPKHERSRS
jgi:ribosomal protein S18 acetylase RimI-like enzyme